MLVDMHDLCDPHEKVCGDAALAGRDRARRQRLGCPGWARVSVGTEEEIEFFLDKLAALEVGDRETAKGGRAEHDGHHGRGRRPRSRSPTSCARVEEVGASAHVSRGRARHGHRRDRRPRGRSRQLPLEAMPGRGPRRRDPQALQARQPRVPAARHGDRRARREDRRRALRAHRRPVLGRDAGAGAGGRPRRQGGRRPHAARRRLQAAHLALRVPGPRRGRPQDAGRGPRRDRPADRHRGDGPARPGRRLRVRRRAPGRRAQHAELPAAGGARQGRQAGAAQARPVDDHRGAADGGRVHRQGGQPRRHPLRARHPHLRDGHAQHASTSAPCP